MPMRPGLALLLAAAALFMAAPGAPAMPVETQSPTANIQTLPDADTRAALPPQNLDTPRTFPAIPDRAAWEARKARIRQQILVACGLAPLPPKTPLKARLFDRVERDGYTIEKVAFQTYPGFYLAGNLYRPGKRSRETVQNPKSKIQHPAVLIAHGHWANGRMANQPEGSISARAITFARQGYVAFTYDMVGYNDTRQITHRFANDARHWLWGVSLMGLQAWNSIRALDFLSSLPDVDKTRLAITGESGGGTQTMILGAIDDRLAAVGPCVMVSHTMQGGCLCENAPGLRVDFSNVEVSAAAAPKLQIIVGASGDWTKDTLTMEGPSVASIYQLYGEPDRLRYVRFDFGHNINQTSREAVYDFFGKKLNGEPASAHLTEPPYTMEPVASLRVFPDDAPMPSDAKTAEQLTDYLVALGKEGVESRKPKDRRSLSLFKKTFQPLWERTLNIEIPDAAQLVQNLTPAPSPAAYARLSGHIGRKGRGDSVPVEIFNAPNANGTCVLLAHPEGRRAFLNLETGEPGPLVQALLAKGVRVLLFDAFLTGERADAKALAARDVPFDQYFSTYNRTNLQERVQDVLTALACARQTAGVKKVLLAGMGEAGLWTLLAAPAADGVVADCNQLDLTTDDALLTSDLFMPCLRRLGDFHTAAALAAPHPLLLHNTGSKFTAAEWIGEVYHAVNATPSLQVASGALDEAALVRWLTSQPGS